MSSSSEYQKSGDCPYDEKRENHTIQNPEIFFKFFFAQNIENFIVRTSVVVLAPNLYDKSQKSLHPRKLSSEINS